MINKEQMQKKIDAHNQSNHLMARLQPVINERLRVVERTRNGFLFKKDIEAINAMIENDAKMFPSVSSAWFAIDTGSKALRYRFIIRNYHISEIIDFVWSEGKPEDFEFKPHILPNADSIIKAQEEHDKMRKELADLMSKLSKIERDFSLNKYSDFVL
jgi:hypothetical protein